MSARVDRAEVEDFLYHEAELLDDWRLEEWRDLFTEECRYFVPSADNPNGDLEMDLPLIDDDHRGVEGRVQRLMSTYAHIENPRSTTTRVISNVRARQGDQSGEVVARANVVVYRSRVPGTTCYVADVSWTLRRAEAPGFQIATKHVVLGHHTLRDVGGVLSIVL